MTRLEEDFCHSLTAAARKPTKQLVVMNKLKAIELKW